MTRPFRFSILAVASILVVSACSASVSIGEGATGASGGTGSTGTTAGGGNVYQANGVSFTYPEDWVELEETSTQASTGDELWSALVGPGSGADTVNLTAYQLRVSVDGTNIADIRQELVSTLTSLAEQAGGAFDGELSNTEMGGLPGFEGTMTTAGTDGQAVTSTVVIVFDGTTEYFVNCQYEADAEAEVLAGCDQVRSSFQVTG